MRRKRVVQKQTGFQRTFAKFAGNITSKEGILKESDL